MADVLVTLPLSFTYGNLKGLAAWCDEGDAAGEPDTGEGYVFSVWGPRPRIDVDERVYVVYDGLLRGYAPLEHLERMRGNDRWGEWGLMRGGGAVAVTIDRTIPGFRGWRYRNWEREAERPFPDWMHVGRNAVPRPSVGLDAPLFADAQGGKQ